MICDTNPLIPDSKLAAAAAATMAAPGERMVQELESFLTAALCVARVRSIYWPRRPRALRGVAAARQLMQEGRPC